jgi:hypothetical protein
MFAATAAAQSVVSPAHFTDAEGSTSNSFPFGVATAPFRYANIHDDMAGTARTIRGMTLRRNNTSAASAAYTVTLDAWMSTAVTTGTTPDATFDNNHGADKLQVATGRTYNFPASPRQFAPEPFVFDVPFDVPFNFAGTGSLCWEVQVTARSNTTSYFLDASSGQGSTNPAMAVNTFGAGCLATGRTTAMGATGTSTMNWTAGTGTLTVNSTNGPASAPAAMVLGDMLPVPFLIPGSDLGPSGPCNVYVNPLVVVGGTTSATGASSYQIPFPATPNLNGLRTFEQVASLDASANSFGLVTSAAVNHNVVAPYGPIPGARIYLSGSLGASGTAVANYSLVVRFNL